MDEQIARKLNDRVLVEMHSNNVFSSPISIDLYILSVVLVGFFYSFDSAGVLLGVFTLYRIYEACKGIKKTNAKGQAPPSSPSPSPSPPPLLLKDVVDDSSSLPATNVALEEEERKDVF